MPWLRRRLRYQRGSSRARSSGRRRSSTSNSSSSSHERLQGRYPNTHSGRGHLATSSPRRVASDYMAPPLSRLVASASLHSPTTAHLHFQCNTNRPLVVATVTVSFRKIPEVIPSPSSPAYPSNMPSPSDIVQPRQASDRGTSHKMGDCSLSHLQNKGK